MVFNFDVYPHIQFVKNLHGEISTINKLYRFTSTNKIQLCHIQFFVLQFLEFHQEKNTLQSQQNMSHMPSSGFVFGNSIGDQLANSHIQETLTYQSLSL